MRAARWPLLVVGLAVLVALGWWLFPSNARRVRTRFQTLATLVSTPSGELDLVRLARARKFGTMLAADVQVTFEERAVPLAGRDTLVVLVARPPEISGGLKAELTNITVQIASDGTHATSSARARLTYTDPQTHQPAAEEDDVTLEWRKIDGEWLVETARVGNSSQ